MTRCDLWFPAPRIPVALGQQRVLPVLVMTLAFSRFMAATMIPSRQAGDILAGMWALIRGVGRVTRTLLWDRESAAAAITGVARRNANRAASSWVRPRGRPAAMVAPEWLMLGSRARIWAEPMIGHRSRSSFRVCGR